MRETGSAPEETLMVGDTSYDMTMARAAGVGAIGVAWGYHPVENLLAGRSDDHPRELRGPARPGAGRGHMKRFYRQVEVASGGDAHRVLLDGRPLRTPAKRPLALPTAALAAAIVAEWRDQGETIRAGDHAAHPAGEHRPGSPAGTARGRDRRAGRLCRRPTFSATAPRAARSGRAPEAGLAAIAGLGGASVYGAGLAVTTSILPVAQPEAAVHGCGRRSRRWTTGALVGLHAATTALGSLVLGLALADGRIDADQAFAASLLDELFEIERWGRDAETERRHAALRRDLEAAATFLGALAGARD